MSPWQSIRAHSEFTPTKRPGRRFSEICTCGSGKVVEGGGGGGAVSMSLASFTGEWKTKQQLSTRSRTQASHILAHPRTHPSPSPSDCVRGVGKSKQAEKDNRANKTRAKNPRKSSGKLKFCQFFVGVNSTNRGEGVQRRDRDTQ